MIVRLASLVKRMIGPALTPSFVRTDVLIPLGLLSVYFVGTSMVLPAGVSKDYATRAAAYLVPLTILSWIAFFFARRLKWTDRELSNTIGDRWSPSDLILLLLPLTPVMQYVLINADILTLLDAAVVVCFFAAGAALLVLVFPTLLGRTGASRPAMYMGLAFAFSLGYMAVLTNQAGWHEWGSLKIQLPVLAGVWIISWLLFRLNLRSVLHLMILAFFMANSVAQLHSQNAAGYPVVDDQTDNKLLALIGSRQPNMTPSIYLLVYDSYVGSETMSAHGIDNQSQEQYLRDLGFKIYPQAYSLAGGTLKSMSRVLNISPTYVLDKEGRKAVSGAGVAQRLLKGLGYTTYGVFPSDFYFRGSTPTYDYSFPGYRSSSTLLIRAILEGEFRFDVGFGEITQEQYTQEKKRVFAESVDKPKFVYTHSERPGHSQMSGTCRPNEAELYARDVKKANLEMQDDIKAILEHDPTAIMIVAGDHGPRLTKDCVAPGEIYDLSEISRLDLQNQYGTFLAIKWPAGEFEQYDDIRILQDMFPAVFAYMFADPGLLDARLEPTTIEPDSVSGARVDNGVIVGGMDDGEPLFAVDPQD